MATSDPLDAMARACSACRRCPLGDQRQQVVISRGWPKARLMLIGEAPGAEEDACGQPFVGRSGQLLDRLLQEAGLGEVYLCNAIKCRPPANRRPRATELEACRPWLAQQLSGVDPALVVLVGGTALEAVLGIKRGITAWRGRWLSVDQGPLQAELAGRSLMAVLHPSYLLRFGQDTEGSPRALTRVDLVAVRRRFDELVS